MNLLFSKRPSAVYDPKDITGNLRDKRQHAKRAFNLVWYLYHHQSLFHRSYGPRYQRSRQCSPRPGSVGNDPTSPISLTNPVPDIQSLSRNCYKTEELAKRLVRDRTINYLHSNNASPSTLLEAPSD